MHIAYTTYVSCAARVYIKHNIYKPTSYDLTHTYTYVHTLYYHHSLLSSLYYMLIKAHALRYVIATQPQQHINIQAYTYATSCDGHAM